MTDYSNIVKELVAFHGRKALAKVRQYGSKPLQVLKQAPIAATAVLGASSTGAPLVIAAGLGITAYAAQKIKAQGIVSYPKTPRELLDELEAMKRSDFLRSPTRSTLTDVEGYINFARKQLRSFNNCLDLRAIPLDNFQNVSNILNSAPIPSCLKKIIFKPDSPEQVTRLIDILKSKKNLPEDFKLVIIGSPETYSLEESFVEVKNETPDSSLVDAAKTAIKEDPVSYAFQETGKEAIRLYGEHLAEHVERLKGDAVEIGGELKGTAESLYEDLEPCASYGYKYARIQGRKAFRQAKEKVKTHVKAGYTGAKDKLNKFTAYMDSVFSGMRTRFSSSPEDSSDEAKEFKKAKRGCLSHYDTVLEFESGKTREFILQIRTLLSNSENMNSFTESLDSFFKSDSYEKLALDDDDRYFINRCLIPFETPEEIAEDLAKKEIFEIVIKYFNENPFEESDS